VLHLTEREARLDVGDAVDAGQRLLHEALVIGEVAGDDAQQIVARARHQVAFEHFRAATDRGLEALHGVLVLALELDRDEDRDWEAKLYLVEEGGVAADDAGFLEQTQAAQAGAGGEADPVGKLRGAQPAVLLERGKQAAVDGVEGEFWRICHGYAQFLTGILQV